MAFFNIGRMSREKRILSMVKEVLDEKWDPGSDGYGDLLNNSIDKIAKEEPKDALLSQSIKGLIGQNRKKLELIIEKESDLYQKEARIKQIISELSLLKEAIGKNILEEGREGSNFKANTKKISVLLRELQILIQDSIDVSKALVHLEEQMKETLSEIKREAA